MKFIQTNDFNLSHTMECGQYFRYLKKDDTYYVGYKDRLFSVKQENNKLFFNNASEQFIKKFFSLDLNYNAVFRECKSNSFAVSARNRLKGLRLIKQDPWECLISYICSANNNIPKIKGMINNLCKTFGKKLVLDNVEMYSFPEQGTTLTNRKAVKKCVFTDVKTKAILEINKHLNSSRLNQLKNKSYLNAFNELLSFYGIGPKIASCVLLFSLGFYEAVPVDVHMKRVLSEKYNLQGSDSSLHSQAVSCFGKYGGIVQQYLFYQQRLNTIASKK